MHESNSYVVFKQIDYIVKCVWVKIIRYFNIIKLYNNKYPSILFIDSCLQNKVNQSYLSDSS